MSAAFEYDHLHISEMLQEDDEDFKCLVTKIMDEVTKYLRQPIPDRHLVRNIVEKKTSEILEEVNKIEEQEENKQTLPMPNLQSHDGKLIKLNNTQLENLLANCGKRTIKGGFGTIYTTKRIVPGLGIRVVLKKIKCKEDEHTKILTTYNERISRRIMHYAVVPLIGYLEKEITSSERKYYFMSPYLETGSLRSCLKQDLKAIEDSEVKLKCLRRIEILFQIASAINFLHTPVKGYRSIILHMDITSSNIVLDTNLNARLIDFGLAREMDEGHSNIAYTQSRLLGTPGYFRTQSYSMLTVREDCYNFGVVKQNKGLPSHNCEAINVCLPCMRKSHLNPIMCPTCGETIIPEIGHTFAAILIAGNDLKNQALSKSFCHDVTEIKDVLASKYPCVIGIREENIKVVVPARTIQNENMLPKISKAFSCLEKKNNINTLVFYYTGHYSPEKGFHLDGRNEVLTLLQLQDYFKKFCKERQNEVKRILAFLDCCYATNLGEIPDLTNENEVKIMQLNVCRPSVKSYQMLEGSLSGFFSCKH